MEILKGKPTKRIENKIEIFEYPSEMKEYLKKTLHSTCKVIARCTPEQKFSLIVAL